MQRVDWRDRWRQVDYAIRLIAAETPSHLNGIGIHSKRVALRSGLPLPIVQRVGLSNAMINEPCRARYDNGMFYPNMEK